MTIWGMRWKLQPTMGSWPSSTICSLAPGLRSSSDTDVTPASSTCSVGSRLRTVTTKPVSPSLVSSRKGTSKYVCLPVFLLTSISLMPWNFSATEAGSSTFLLDMRMAIIGGIPPELGGPDGAASPITVPAWRGGAAGAGASVPPACCSACCSASSLAFIASICSCVSVGPRTTSGLGGGAGFSHPARPAANPTANTTADRTGIIDDLMDNLMGDLMDIGGILFDFKRRDRTTRGGRGEGETGFGAGSDIRPRRKTESEGFEPSVRL
ncbi:MAG: hypothetical protein H6684_12505 [Deltaproteobacteria bacterium]|nr:hypothetical protein [Deltaproteobacteria bacterium]